MQINLNMLLPILPHKYAEIHEEMVFVYIELWITCCIRHSLANVVDNLGIKYMHTPHLF